MIALAFGAVLLGLVIAIAAVDARRLIIPDGLNAMLALAGLAWQTVRPDGAPLVGLVAGAAVFLALWGFAAGFRRLRGVTGLGFGDVKMAGAAALWVSPWNLPILFIAGCAAALVTVAVLGRTARAGRVPFGPFIGLGLLLTWGLERSGLPTLVPAVG